MSNGTARLAFIFIVSALVLTALGAPCAQAENVLTIESVRVQPGQRGVVVSISAATDRPLTLLSLDISFDRALCRSLQNQSIRKAGRTRVVPEEGGVRCPAEGKLQVALVEPMGGTAVSVGEGPIVEWVFDVTKRAPSGVFPLHVTLNQASNGPVAVPLKTLEGALAISKGTASTTRAHRARNLRSTQQPQAD
jgi:hypothetical protein